MSITVLVPAHNEEASLPATLAALRRQPVDRLLVVADNCTDGTAEAARAGGADVVETVGNADRKAGALNQALALLLPGLADDDLVLIVDADTTIADSFLPAAHEAFASDPGIVAVGGVFSGDSPGTVLEHCQANEYARFAREVERKRRTMVLSGTSSLVRASALRAVANARGAALPGPPGDVYNRHAITEDMELSLALKALGGTLASPAACAVTTELMPTPRDLYRQRVRWFGGAVQALRYYGLTRVTAPYWLQQAMLAWGTLIFALMFAVLPTALAVYGFSASPLWTTVTAIFITERLVTVWAGASSKGRIVAALLIPELVYCAFLFACFVGGVAAAVTGRHQWNHVSKGQAHVSEPARR